MQQHLPFTVLKLTLVLNNFADCKVATALTVYGIETVVKPHLKRIIFFHVATALTVYGIETDFNSYTLDIFFSVATALTVYGIETLKILTECSVRFSVATALTVYGIETA